MFIITVIALFIGMALALARAVLGPSLYDRILTVNMMGTKAVLFIAVLGFLMGRPHFLDIAMVYALINFISVIAILRFFEYESHQKQSSGSDNSDYPEKQIAGGDNN